MSNPSNRFKQTIPKIKTNLISKEHQNGAVRYTKIFIRLRPYFPTFFSYLSLDQKKIRGTDHTIRN